MNNANARGFTLIELVVVIALLGILAAFAIPRFASLESEARAATIQGLAGSLRSASAMAHGLHLATGSDPVSMEGVNIDIELGYPSADDAPNSLADLTGFDINLATPAAGSTTFNKTGTTSGCSVRYDEVTVSGNAPDVTVDTSGC